MTPPDRGAVTREGSAPRPSRWILAAIAVAAVAALVIALVVGRGGEDPPAGVDPGVEDPRIAINAGGEEVTAGDLSYGADAHAEGGRTSSATVSSDREDAEVFSDVRVGATGYSVPVPDGTYEVTFQTLENYWTEPGRRVFDVTLEGLEVLADFDPFLAAGGKDEPITRTLRTTVTDGSIDLEFDADQDQSIIAGLVVTPQDGGLARTAGTAWEQVFFDDFGSGLDDEHWWRYGGIATASGSPYSQEGVEVVDGNLVLTSRRGADGVWRGAGVGSRLNQTYGRWTVRARGERGHGITMVFLLWPTIGNWPPEIDFAEDNAEDRDMMSATVHFENGVKVHHEREIDSTQWHDYTVEWTPGETRFLIDGELWATVVDGRVPSEPMRLGLQSEAWLEGTDFFHPIDETTPAEVRVFIDSVTVETRAGS
ncbi:malectin domain-containing carbohydrate-binding protein [Kineococcus xinjiangensis]|nr:malectin domain-containing carbohydrate-binding protein [Kineococcus xinjiangensis]